MAKKKLTPAQLRDRKMKRVAVGLVVVLIGVLAFQAPTIMKIVGGGGSNAAAPPATTPSTTTSGTGAVPATGSTPAGPLGSVGFTPLANNALWEFGSFAPKDPFRAQVGATSTTPSGPTSTTASSTAKAPSTTSGTKAKGTTPAKSKKTVTTGNPIPITGPTTTVPFTTVQPNAAVIMTNGKRQVVPLGKGFPREAPLFKLVSLATHPKAIRISVLGGSFTNGAPTLLLRRGAKLELANESNGTRYTITLVGLMAMPTTTTGTGTSGSAP